MRIRICIAYLTIDNKEVRVNRSIARQFPILDGRERMMALESGEDAPMGVCKVLGSTLGENCEWLLLVESPVSDWAWVPAHTPHDELAEVIEANGGTVDDVLLVPTVIL